MIGVSRTTGKALSGDAHLAQSIGDILTTPIGTRVMRRDYGSGLAGLIDAPLNALTRLRLYAAAALAIHRWEPRLAVDRFAFEGDGAGLAGGAVTLRIDGHRTDRPGATASLSIPLFA